MTTSIMTYTAQNIVDDALYQAGKKDIGNPAETELVEISLRMYNGMLKYWQSRGVQLHTIQEIEIPLWGSKQSYVIRKDGTGDYDIDRPMRIIGAHRKDNVSLYEIPIDVISYEEYHEITIKSIVAPVQQVAMTKQADQMTVYIWPIADDAAEVGSAYSLMLAIQRALNIAETGGNTPDLPSEMYLAAVYGLSDLMCKGKDKDIAKKAQDYFTSLLMTDQESVSLFFHPETR